MSKIVYIIPGFTDNINDKGYQEVIGSFRAQDFRVVLVEISWRYRVMSDYVDEFYGQLVHKKNDEICLFGFSFGAMIAFVSATNISPQTIFLCSLAPFFKEDLRNLPKCTKKDIGKRRLEDFKEYFFKELAGKIKCRTILVAGEREPQDLLERAEKARKKIKSSELFIINKAKHNISQKEYWSKLQEIISTL